MRVKILILTILFLFFGEGSVLAIEPPTLTSPDNNSTASTSTLIWGTPSYALYSSKPYRIQVDEDSTFSSPEKDYTTDNTSYTPVLSEGTWYWKVKAKDSTGSWSDWSNNWFFILSSSPSPTPTASPTPSATTTSTPSPTANTSSVSSQFTISDIPTQINSDQSFGAKIVLVMPNNPSTVYYLKGAFKIKDGSRYFGLTKKDNDWIEYGDEYSDQLKITTDSSGNWSGNLEVKPDTFDKDYKGSGDYIFKVARITTSNSSTWSNETSIKINSTTTSTTQTSTQPSTQPTKPPTPEVNNKATSTSKPSIESSNNSKNSEASIAGVNTESNDNENNDKKQGSINLLSVFGIIMILAGASLLGYILLKTTGAIDLLLKLWKR